MSYEDSSAATYRRQRFDRFHVGFDHPMVMSALDLECMFPLPFVLGQHSEENGICEGSQMRRMIGYT